MIRKFLNRAARPVALVAVTCINLSGIGLTNAFAQWGGAGTAASANMNGMSNIISARGNYNLSTSAAAINMTKAESQELQNRQQATDTYFSMRATNRAATEQERGPHPSMEQLARMARDYAPKPFGSQDMDQVSGQIRWPAMLQTDLYSAERNELDQLQSKAVSQGQLSFPDQMKARQTIESMFHEMKTQIKEVPPQQYTECRTFLRSMIYSMSQSELE